MTRPTIPQLTALFFCVLVVGLLAWRRFDLPPQQAVAVIASQESDHKAGTRFPRGTILETGDNEYLAIKIGERIIVTMDERSRLELSRLFEDERVLTFTRGRIVVKNEEKAPVFIDTHKTENALMKGEAIFINYDFQQLVTVAPVTGNIQTHLKGQKEYLLVPNALNVSETDPPSISQTTVDPTQGPSAPFHEWTTYVFATNPILLP